jgi:septal ring factor EnvC (AmiA/AmiB activator)
MMTDAFEDAKGFHDHLNRLIVFCSVKPPYSDRHVAALEQQLLLAKQQIKDVMRFRASLYLETERLESTTIRKVKLRIKAIQHQRASIASKIEKRRAAIERSKKEIISLDEALAELREMNATNDGMIVLSSSLMSGTSQDSKSGRNKNNSNHVGFHHDNADGEHFILSQESGESSSSGVNHKIRFG